MIAKPDYKIVDPLKPLGSIIRSVWDKTVRHEHREKSIGTAIAGENTQAAALSNARPVQSLHARLRSRIPNANGWDAAQARDVFVESVLLSELGDDLANDPAFTQTIKNISLQLGSDPKLTARLDLLLQQLSQDKAVR